MKRLSSSLAALLAATAFAPTHAGTAISLSIVGQPIPGKQVIVQAQLTGDHIVGFGPAAVPPGAVNFYANGQSLGQVFPVGGNSTGSHCSIINDPVFVDLCVAPSSTLAVAFTFPSGATSAGNFFAHFDGDALYDGSSSPTLTVTARQPALTSFGLPSGEQHWAIVGSNGNLYNIYWTPTSGYQFSDASAAVSAPQADHGALTSFVLSSGEQHWGYIGTDGNVYNLYWSPTSGYHLDNASTSSAAPAASTGALTSFTLASGEQHWAYIGTNGHAYDIFWSPVTTSYHVQDVTALAGAPTAANGALTSFALATGEQHWSYIGTNGHVYNLYRNPNTLSYSTDDATAAAGAPAAASGALTSFALASGEQHWGYVGTDGHVYNLYWSATSFTYGLEDATAGAAAPAAASGALTSFVLSSGQQHWGFIGTNGHTYDLYLDLPTHTYHVADGGASAGAPTAVPGALSSFVLSSGEQHWAYLGTNGDIYNLYWTPVNGSYQVNDISTAAGVP